ncbi:MAG: ABC transporter permease, partial [Nitrospirae bacterium]
SIDAKQMIGPVVVFLFVKELAPLLSSGIIFIRSGPAIVSELALMKINKEVQALEFMGIDTFSYLIFPRMVAVIVSNYILSVFISFMALIGGFLVLGFVHYMRFYDYVLLLTKEMGLDDFVFFVQKVGLFGLLIGASTMHRALQVERTFTSVPVALIRALVSLMLYMLILEGVFALLQTGL